MSAYQDEFAQVLLTPDAPEPEQLRDPKGGPAGRRFDVYRNNVAASLTEALEDGFPALVTLIGPRRFKALAGVMLRAHPPSDPRLFLYGAALADLLPQIEPLAPYPFLADVARLEYALRLSYHAADSTPIDAGAFAQIPEAALDSTRLRFAPATRLLRSGFAVFDIWRSTQSGLKPARADQPQSVLITRPALDPQPMLITEDQAEAIAAAMSGAPLGQIADLADLGEVLHILLTTGALCGLNGEPT